MCSKNLLEHILLTQYHADSDTIFTFPPKKSWIWDVKIGSSNGSRPLNPLVPKPGVQWCHPYHKIVFKSQSSRIDGAKRQLPKLSGSSRCLHRFQFFVTLRTRGRWCFNPTGRLSRMVGWADVPVLPRTLWGREELLQTMLKAACFRLHCQTDSSRPLCVCVRFFDRHPYFSFHSAEKR